MKPRSLPALPVDPLPLVASGLVVLAAAAPWLLGFSGNHAAVANGIAFAMAFAPLGLMIGALSAASAACGAGGLWLAASPWAFGYGSSGIAAWAADLILGVGLIVIAWRRRTPFPASTTLSRNDR